MKGVITTPPIQVLSKSGSTISLSGPGLPTTSVTDSDTITTVPNYWLLSSQEPNLIAVTSNASTIIQSFTNIPLTDITICNSSYIQSNNTYVTLLKTGWYEFIGRARWNDLQDVNNCLFTLSINGALEDNDFGVWLDTEQRLTSVLYHTAYLQSGTTISLCGYSNIQNTIKPGQLVIKFLGY